MTFFQQHQANSVIEFTLKSRKSNMRKTQIVPMMILDIVATIDKKLEIEGFPKTQQNNAL